MGRNHRTHMGTPPESTPKRGNGPHKLKNDLKNTREDRKTCLPASYSYWERLNDKIDKRNQPTYEIIKRWKAGNTPNDEELYTVWRAIRRHVGIRSKLEQWDCSTNTPEPTRDQARQTTDSDKPTLLPSASSTLESRTQKPTRQPPTTRHPQKPNKTKTHGNSL